MFAAMSFFRTSLEGTDGAQWGVSQAVVLCTPPEKHSGEFNVMVRLPPADLIVVPQILPVRGQKRRCQIPGALDGWFEPVFLQPWDELRVLTRLGSADGSIKPQRRDNRREIPCANCMHLGRLYHTGIMDEHSRHH